MSDCKRLIFETLTNVALKRRDKGYLFLEKTALST